MDRPQIKICGLTDVSEAVTCAELGADAIGLVFFPKSPRNISENRAAEISTALPHETAVVGVFVNETFDFIMNKVEKCGLSAVQLHGNEPPELVDRLKKEQLNIIKVLYIESDPHISSAPSYNSSAFLVECAKGVLPGGNALSWNWEKTRNLITEKPIIIAGGLSPDNINDAVLASLPDAVDVSSGVECEPGRKDLSKAEAFIKKVSECSLEKTFRRIF